MKKWFIRNDGVIVATIFEILALVLVALVFSGVIK
jgi:hypothetical protein